MGRRSFRVRLAAVVIALLGSILVPENVAAAGVWSGSADAQIPSSADPTAEPTADTASKSSHAAAISTSGAFTLVIGSDGTVTGWGDNSRGQLGDGTTDSRAFPVPVASAPGVRFVAVSAGGSHTVALSDAGQVYAWGANDKGQLGIGSTSDERQPVRANTPREMAFSAVAAGDGFTLALASSGQLYAWGWNSFGQLGIGSTTDQTEPAAVHAPDGVQFTQVATGLYRVVALATDGSVYAWGWNDQGQLGDGTKVDQTVPVRLHSPPGVTFKQLASGTFESFALASNGDLYSWGQRSDDRKPDSPHSDPAAMVRILRPDGVTFTDIAAGAEHLLALTPDGKLYAWGDNSRGQLGIGTFESSQIPVAVGGGDPTFSKLLAAGDLGSYARGSDGYVYGWGANSHGQLGDVAAVDRSSPVRIQMPDGSPVVTAVQNPAASTTSGPAGADAAVPASARPTWPWMLVLLGLAVLVTLGLVTFLRRRQAKPTATVKLELPDKDLLDDE